MKFSRQTLRQRIHKDHHPHLTRRMVLELVGLLILFPLLWKERDLIDQSLEIIRRSDLLFVGLAAILYWLILPLAGKKLQILAERKINLKDTMLADLAGSGPGRIIPGGLGRISITTLHLKKARISTDKAVAISIFNNLISVLVHSVVIVGILFLHPNIRSELVNQLHQTSLVVLTLIAVSILSLLLWAHHARAVRRHIRRTEKNLIKLAKSLLKRPKKLITTILISLGVLLINGLIVMFCSRALNLNVSLIDSVLVLSGGLIFGALLPSPGGIGVVEAGITAVLAIFGYPLVEAAGVSMLFRIISYWIPLLPGFIAYEYLIERRRI